MSGGGDTTSSKSIKQKVISSDALFGYIERSQIEHGKPFDRILDAGTGTHSLRWIADLIHSSSSSSSSESSPLFVRHYTAVTADESMRQEVVEEARKLNISDKGDVVIGNWCFPQTPSASTQSSAATVATTTLETLKNEEIMLGNLLHDQVYDTILADYLIGAMDGFSPFYQDLIISRLNRHLVPGGRLYIVGLQPIPDSVNTDANIMCKVTKLRDACILLAGHRCYREYPVDWVIRQVERVPGLKVVKVSQFPILYSHNTIKTQLDVARRKLPYFPTKQLANEMEKVINALEDESEMLTEKSPNKKLKLGFDYVIVVEKDIDDNRHEEGAQNELECGEI